ncbi:4-hydroxybenzoate synthetase [Cohnella faecalis]|uniref:4-hydroxybenzoate synthetase n=2 Tax=Cohnella faecalis TaxID=2315694 RepID=A0A398CP26_9BACL|nr:4-hydroxybenzoate synthetase [Cohnella faecalis]
MFDYLHGLLFDILLTTDGRTTDMLETLMDDKMTVKVIRQEQLDDREAAPFGQPSGGPYYVRESVLIGEKSGFVVSHNIALVCSPHVPLPLFEAISSKQEGIGKTISALGLQTLRKLTEYGWKSADEAVDLFDRPLALQFPRMKDKAPYKKYTMSFGPVPGILLLEYFNPGIVMHRVQRTIVDNQKKDDLT